MDVRLAFRKRFLEEEVYIEQPLNYMWRREDKKVLRLKKALYDLKQAPEHGMTGLTIILRRVGMNNT